MGATLGNNFMFFSMQMSHFGLTPAHNKKIVLFNPVKSINYFSANDSCYSDMTLRGARALNETIWLSPDTYYYSYTANVTVPTGNSG